MGRPPARVQFTPPSPDTPVQGTSRAPNAILTAVRLRYPDTVCWYGCFTRHYWFVSPRQTLIEAADEYELAHLLGAWFPPVPLYPASERPTGEHAPAPFVQDSRDMASTRVGTSLAISPSAPRQRPGSLRRTLRRLAQRPTECSPGCEHACCNPALRQPVNPWSSSC